ncbi:MAG: hypothetical protein WC842_01170 [Candidatus Paceibacterota bacterium]|jgi:hypothetical protein
MEKAPDRHVVILLLSAAFILAQFIVELILVSFLINVFPPVGTFLYGTKWIPTVIHMTLTVILLWYAGTCGDHYCRHMKKNDLKK